MLRSSTSEFVVKGVCGKLLSRKGCVKLLKTKFCCTSRKSYTTYILIVSVRNTKKVVNSKYVSVPEHIEFSKLKTENIKVKTEIIGMRLVTGTVSVK